MADDGLVFYSAEHGILNPVPGGYERAPQVTLAVSDKVKFSGDRRWWTVRATDGERFVILTRQAEFQPKGTSLYTIIDWERDLRGPCNLIGQGWEIDVPDGPESLLDALTGNDPDLTFVEVSYRNNVPIDITERKAA